MRRVLAILSGVSIVTSGCSFAFVSGPPSNHEQLPSFTCTESRLVPGLDTAFTAIQAINLAYAASVSDATWEDNFDVSRTGSIILYVGLVALGGAGMYYGFTKTKQCRAAKEQLIMRGGGDPAQPSTWPPPGQPAPPTAPL